MAPSPYRRVQKDPGAPAPRPIYTERDYEEMTAELEKAHAKAELDREEHPKRRGCLGHGNPKAYWLWIKKGYSVRPYFPTADDPVKDVWVVTVNLVNYPALYAKLEWYEKEWARRHFRETKENQAYERMAANEELERRATLAGKMTVQHHDAA